MTTKSDKTITQPTDESNPQIPTAEESPARHIAAGLEKTIRAEIADRADLTPEEVFNFLSDFAASLAQASIETLEVMESIMHDRDHTYPKGLLTPLFLVTMIESSQGNCQLVRLPPELTKGLEQSLIAQTPPKEMLN